jgi:ribose transport system substrate-binding protein
MRSSKTVLSAAVAMVTVYCAGLPASASAGTIRTSDVQSTSPVTVTFVGADIVDPYFIAGECGSIAAAKKYNVKFSFTGIAGTSYQDELTAFDAVVQKHPDAIVVAPFSTTAFSAPIEAAAKAGIKIIISDTEYSQPGAIQAIGTNQVNNGTLAADGLAQAIGGKGDVASVSFDSTNPVPAGIVKGFHDELAAKWPNIHVVATEYSGADAAKAASITEGLLQRYPNLAGIYGTDTTDATGVISGVKAAGDIGKVKVIAQDAGPLQMSQLDSGELAGITAQAPYQIHYLSIEDAASAVRTGKNPSPYAVVLPGAYITKANQNTPTIKNFVYPTHCS